MIRKTVVAAVLAFISLTLASCGYHFSGEGEGPKPGLTFIAIPVFENKTSEQDLGALFAGALRHEFMQKGGMRVVDAAESEAVFKGSIVNIRITPVAHRASDVVANRVTVENRLYVTLDIRCEEKRTGKVLWRDPNLQVYRVYRQSDNPLHPDALGGYEDRQEALHVLAREAAIRVHDRFLSDF
ncbi:MAG: LPS assembly lipoprotein LptE [Desulfobacteraceae bacterium]|nr:LPS assembly lipoprotein LptE [Desulfobacteraceae bacterium]